MQSREESRREVRLAVRAHMAWRGWNKAELQDAAGIDPNTAGDFLNGQRWPQARTLARIEKALEWAPGTISAALEGAPLPAVPEPDVEEESDASYVTAPGERADSSVTNAEVLAAIREMTEAIRQMNEKLDRGGTQSGEGGT